MAPAVFGCIVLSDLKPGTVITAKETATVDGFVLDGTPKSIEIKEGEGQILTFYNAPVGGLELIKVSESDKTQRIPNVNFEIRRMDGALVETVVTDSTGRVHVDLDAGDYYAVEIEAAKGFKVDETPQYFTIKDGETTTISGQIQITKKSADYNSTNGLPAGTLLEGAVFEIYDKASNLVDTIRSDGRGLAVSRQLPLGRYTIREVKAPANYGVNETPLTAYLEHEGQIVRFEVTNKSMSTGVSITKTGPAEVMAGQPVNYTFSGIANSSNVRLDNFYWRDALPAEVRLEKIVTGTYNFPGTYKITYRVNGGEPQTLADNLSTQKNYTLAASATALGLASNERVTEIMFVFGQVPGGFAQVEKPMLHCKAVSSIAASSFVNKADVGGTYNGVWVQAVSRWVTTVYGKKPSVPKLPRTGY